MINYKYINKFQTAFSLVTNRDRWPFLLRKVEGILGKREIVWDLTSNEALNICKKNCCSAHSAFKILFKDSLWDEFSESKKNLLNHACQRVARARDSGSVMGGGMEIDLLFNLVRRLKPEKIVETGVAYGWSSLAILSGLAENNLGGLWSSNLAYAGMDCEEDVGCAIPDELRARWSLFRGPDCFMLPQIVDEIKRCQMVVYDSDKSYAGRRASAKLLWGILDVGGLFVSDDISDNLGFLHFAQTTGQRPLIVEHVEKANLTKYVGILQKHDEKPLRDIWF